ncbi:hypothetical protein Hydth_0396 [Hydrogenobacter thermophilus TK-6]|uniref:hypothetical protein n=1 Tax=Hydrogenobacter thermophilus TaxID=940 RepID=UPI0001E6567A|nr:hypothetical protein [Hydrogenobacter thermophilus]ADO44797.1 hypothetical protein Hydth_0396 [Hydrogenobacter thermophilus TK-6]
MEGKENTKTLLVIYNKRSFAEYFINQIKIRREAKRLNMAMLGSVAGLITFGVCSMFLVPYVKTKL